MDKTDSIFLKEIIIKRSINKKKGVNENRYSWREDLVEIVDNSDVKVKEKKIKKKLKPVQCQGIKTW